MSRAHASPFPGGQRRRREGASAQRRLAQSGPPSQREALARAHQAAHEEERALAPVVIVQPRWAPDEELGEGVFYSHELLESRGRQYMRVCTTVATVLVLFALVLIVVVSSPLGLAVFWLGGAVMTFGNYAAARLGVPVYTFGPAAAGYGTVACLFLAVTAAVAATFG